MIFLKIFLILLLDAAAILAAWRISKLKKPYWTFGYIAGIFMLFFIALPQYVDVLAFKAPFTWALAGRNEFVILAVCASLVLVSIIPKAEKCSYKILLGVLLAIILGWYSLAPFTAPWFFEGKHKALKNQFFANNVCKQSLGYTCGPAAAVTALKQLGVNGKESDLTVESLASGVAGTQADLLVNGIKKLYGDQGIDAEFKLFKDINELRDENGSVIVVTRLSFLLGHYMTVLDITDTHVVVGDPNKGKKAHLQKKFNGMWRKTGVVVRKK